jgi:bacterioferritin B
MAPEPHVVGALNAQLGRELEAHLQYLAISSWFNSEALPQLAGFFAAQAAEEHAHAMKFLTYLQDSGGTVAIPGLAAPIGGFAGADEAIQAALDSEMDVTARISELVDLARAHNDHASEIFLQWFVTEQVEEVATMTELLQIARRAGEDGLLLVEEHIARSGGPTA